MLGQELHRAILSGSELKYTKSSSGERAFVNKYNGFSLALGASCAWLL